MAPIRSAHSGAWLGYWLSGPLFIGRSRAGGGWSGVISGRRRRGGGQGIGTRVNESGHLHLCPQRQ